MDSPISCPDCKLLYFQNKINGVDTLTVTDLINYHGVCHLVVPKNSLPPSTSSNSNSSPVALTVASVTTTTQKIKTKTNKPNDPKQTSANAIRTRAREAVFDSGTLHFEWFIYNEGKEQLYLPVGDIVALAGYSPHSASRMAGPYGAVFIRAQGIHIARNYFTLHQALQFLKSRGFFDFLECIQQKANLFESEHATGLQEKRNQEADAMIQS